MIYKFHSKATGDVIMLGPNGDQMLRLIGRDPAAKGIIEPPSMPAAVAALEAAIAADEAARAESKAKSDDDKPADAVALRPRMWPMIEMLKRAHRADEPIVWGV
jgi:hypothetical protein